MRCCAHILSLVVKDGLKEVEDSIVRIRDAVKYVRCSPARLTRFKACVEQAKIQSKGLVCLDVETRWNSTYMMLESAIKFQEAFDMLEEEDSKYLYELTKKGNKGTPTKEDWDYARSLLPFLRGFYTSTLRISGSLYVTSNNYFLEVFGIGAMIRKRMTDEDKSLASMAKKMKLKFDKYWSNISNINIYLFIAPILDPRHKLDFVISNVRKSYDDKTATELCEKIDNVFDALFKHYSSVVGVVNESKEINHEHDEDSKMEIDDDPATFLNNEYKREIEEKMKNESRFPVLSTMAKDILAIQASTVASESAFSTGGRILDAFRSSLTPGLVEALVCSQNWLRSKNAPLDIEEKLADLEIFESEIKDLAHDVSPITVED